MKKQFIPEDFYRKVVDTMPILGVDVVVEYGGGILMIKRSEKPCKGQWWFPGGRVLKYEHPEKTALRKTKEETGLNGKIKKLLGIETTNFERWPDIKHFSVHLVYYVKANGRVKLDKTSTEWRVFKKINPKWHNYVKKFVKESGVIK